MKNREDIVQEKDLLNDERISRFLQGLMKESEEAAFIEELKKNVDLRKQAITQARLVKGMKQIDEELKDAFRHADEQTIKRIASQATKKENKSVHWLAYAASIILIVFVGFKGYDYYSTVNLGKQYANTFVLSDIVRGESNSEVENELKGLFDNVINGKDLRKTTERLDAIWQIAKQDTYNDYTDYAPYIGWYLAIGYLRDYEKLKANKILVEMNEMYPIGTSIGDGVKDVLRKCD